MVDFSVAPEVEDLRARYRAFVRDVVLPAEATLGPGEPDAKAVEDLRGKARSTGLFGPGLPREWGGLGLAPVAMALVAEELGASFLGPLAVNASAPDEGNMHALLAFGTPAQRERWLAPLAAGRIRSAFAMTEEDAGSDPSRIQATATRVEGGYVLHGAKRFVTGADGAAVALVVARAPEGPTIFLVDAATPGYEVARRIPVMGTHAPGGHCEVRLDGARVADADVLGAVGQGFGVAQHRLGWGRVTHAMRWIGAARRALDLAASRALSRETFGAPLSDRQAVQWMLAESAIDLHAARLMVLHAAWKIERGLEHRQEVSMVKVHAANALQRIADRAIQIHGALGYSEDSPLSRIFRDARAARIYDGPDEVHLHVVARNVLRSARDERSTRSATGAPP